MASFRKIRNLLVERYGDEFLLLYDANSSKNPDFPYDYYGSFDLNEMDDSECLAEFRFHTNDIPVLFEAWQLPQSFTCHQGTICDGIEALCITLRTICLPMQIQRFNSNIWTPSSRAEYDIQLDYGCNLSRAQSQTNSVE